MLPFDIITVLSDNIELINSFIIEGNLSSVPVTTKDISRGLANFEIKLRWGLVSNISSEEAYGNRTLWLNQD